MKLKLLFFALAGTTLLSAQSTNLNGDWYLKKMTIDGVSESPQNEQSIARLSYEVGWDFINTEVCMQRSYNISSINNSSYIFGQTSGIAGTCNSPVTTIFQTRYLNAFQKTPNFQHNYVVQGTGAGKILVLTTSAGDVFEYGTTKSLSTIDNVKVKSQIFPNPVKDILNVKLDRGVTSLKVYDLNGRLVNSNVGKNTIDVKQLPKGQYIISIETELNTEIVKIVKD